MAIKTMKKSQPDLNASTTDGELEAQLVEEANLRDENAAIRQATLSTEKRLSLRNKLRQLRLERKRIEQDIESTLQALENLALPAAMTASDSGSSTEVESLSKEDSWWENPQKEIESLSKEDSSDDEVKTDIISNGEPKEEGDVPWWELTTKPQGQTIKPPTNLAGEGATSESKDSDANKDGKDEEATEKSNTNQRQWFDN